MNEKLLRLLKEYKEREQYLSSLIEQLSKSSAEDKKALEDARLARVLWRQVIQDLEKIVR